MTDIYLHFMCAHYGLSRNAPVAQSSPQGDDDLPAGVASGDDSAVDQALLRVATAVRKHFGQTAAVAAAAAAGSEPLRPTAAESEGGRRGWRALLRDFELVLGRLALRLGAVLQPFAFSNSPTGTASVK